MTTHNRRSFIATAGAAGAAAAAAASLPTFAPLPTFAQEKAERPRSNKGLVFKSTKTNGGINMKQLKNLKDLGFDGIESVSPGVKDIPALKKMCKDVGLPIHGVVDMVHWKQTLSHPEQEVRDKGRAALEQAIRDSHALGGSSVLLVPGVVRKGQSTHEECWNRSIEEINKAIPTASWYGIHILIETVWNGFCYKPEEFRDYLDEINNPWVGAYYDIGNMQKFAPSHEWIRRTGASNPASVRSAKATSTGRKCARR